MSEVDDLKPRKLPPLGRSGEAVNNDPSISVRKKKKRRDLHDESPRENRPRSNSRSRGRALPSPRNEPASEVEREAESPVESTHTRKTPSPRKHQSKQPENEQEDDAPTRRKIRKKKDFASQEELVENDEVDGVGVSEYVEKPKRKKKKRKARTRPEEELGYDNLGLAADLSGLHDDVTVAEGPTEPDYDKSVSKVPALRSEPVGRLFIEQGSGFKSADKNKIAKKRAEDEARLQQLEMIQPTTLTTIQLGITTHRVFKVFTLFCHGLLAGFALWHIVTVFSLHNVATDYKEFLRIYSPLAMPVQCLYYILFVLCTVSVFDRYDIGRPTRRDLLRCVTMQSGAISILFYFISLVISLSIAATDDKINLHHITPELWEQVGPSESELNTWRILNLIRGIGALLGWIIISLKPQTDRLIKNLESADENILGDFTEHPDVVRSSGV